MHLFINFLLVSVISGSMMYRYPEILVNDFEKHPGYLGGKPESWGASYPLSGYMTLYSADFNPRFVHTGSYSYKLVNSPRAKEDWASVSINLGPITDAKTDPITVRPIDVSHYKYFSFWIRGKDGGERFKVIFRDGRSKSYIPTINYSPKNNFATQKWRRIDIPLHTLNDVSQKYEKRDLDLSQLVVVGFEFGDNTGNSRGSTLYIDDLSFRRK